jgi:hypothetical protein
MNRLNDQAFQAQVNSRLSDRTRRGKPTDFQSVAGELIDHGLVPQRKSLWDWARQVCGEGAA